MKKKVINSLFSILPAMLVIIMLGSIIYLLIENTRQTFVINSSEYALEKKVIELDDVRNELVESQNLAHGYKWQLDLINKDEGWGGDE
ncbi:hypothetical protein [Carnobacterium sp. ISL-102]|uniref:hypothetical protein n=1 Tax=Carnobacterium sp. ISL-102 TaxID=2819142 RepID=UPI001BE8BB9A|nr:hypothetical protein [Carnobacterium sp. ISL-102]MBT2732101.1 hypothetical protein [Carnobacterium sp. ISL-102]